MSLQSSQGASRPHASISYTEIDPISRRARVHFPTSGPQITPSPLRNVKAVVRVLAVLRRWPRASASVVYTYALTGLKSHRRRPFDMAAVEELLESMIASGHIERTPEEDRRCFHNGFRTIPLSCGYRIREGGGS